MFKQALIIAGIVGAAIAFQTPAQAHGSFDNHSHRVGGHHDHFNGHGHRAQKFHHKKHLKHRKHHRRSFALSNRELRYVLRDRGLRRIRIHDRYDGIAKLTAVTPRGYLARFKVSTRNGEILKRRIIRPVDYHPRHRRFDDFHGGHSGAKFIIKF